jgi:hypothetical protein
LWEFAEYYERRFNNAKLGLVDLESADCGK